MADKSFADINLVLCMMYNGIFWIFWQDSWLDRRHEVCNKCTMYWQVNVESVLCKTNHVKKF